MVPLLQILHIAHAVLLRRAEGDDTPIVRDRGIVGLRAHVGGVP